MNFVTRFFSRFSKPPKTGPVADDDAKVTRYLLTGAAFGDAVSYIYMGECIGFANLLADWVTAERDYAAMGYRTVSLDEFVSLGGWGKEINTLRVPREVGEEPVFHAAYYREHHLGK